MINQEELAICRKRGHVDLKVPSRDWEQCAACGMWVRLREVIDEREDDPPEDERGLVWRTGETLKRVRKRL